MNHQPNLRKNKMKLAAKLIPLLQTSDKGNFAVISSITNSEVYLNMADNVTAAVKKDLFGETTPKLKQKLYFNEQGDIVLTEDEPVDTTSKPIRNTPAPLKSIW